MKRIITYLTIAFLTFAVGVTVALNLHLFKKAPESKVSAASSVSPAYHSDVIKIVRAPNEPVNIVDIRFANTGDLIVEVDNTSSKPIIFVGYVLSPFDRCPKSDHPMALWVGYGDWSVLSNDSSHKIDPPVGPSHKVTLTVSRKAYEGILSSQKSAKCPSSAKPELYLNKVAFSDGSGWEGFADGVDHSEWNGRLWVPERKK
jgi:hypothetical protein